MWKIVMIIIEIRRCEKIYHDHFLCHIARPSLFLNYHTLFPDRNHCVVKALSVFIVWLNLCCCTLFSPAWESPGQCPGTPHPYCFRTSRARPSLHPTKHRCLCCCQCPGLLVHLPACTHQPWPLTWPHAHIPQSREHHVPQRPYCHW